MKPDELREDKLVTVEPVLGGERYELQARLRCRKRRTEN